MCKVSGSWVKPLPLMLCTALEKEQTIRSASRRRISQYSTKSCTGLVQIPNHPLSGCLDEKVLESQRFSKRLLNAVALKGFFWQASAFLSVIPAGIMHFHCSRLLHTRWPRRSLICEALSTGWWNWIHWFSDSARSLNSLPLSLNLFNNFTKPPSGPLGRQTRILSSLMGLINAPIQKLN